jgi:hypothetical protein
MTNVDGQQTYEKNIRRNLSRLIVMFAIGLLLSLVLIFFIPDEILKMHPPAIVILLFKSHDIYFVGLCFLLLIWLRAEATWLRWLKFWSVRIFERPGQNRLLQLLITLVTLTICLFGVHYVFEEYALSPDEFFVDFVAQSIAAGFLLTPLDPLWRDFASALQPSFVQVSAGGNYWSPLWRPGNAMIVAVFDLLGAHNLGHAVLTAGCLPLIAMLAKRFWPDYPSAPILAMLLLALSPQFMLTGMTRYAMTSHLFFGLLWLVLFLRDTKMGHVGAALTGFFAVGIHHIHIHPLFVLPFMIGLLRDRRWTLSGFYAVWYSAALLIWFFWRDIAELVQRGDANSLSDFAYLSHATTHYLTSHGIIDVLYWLVNIFRFISWQSFALIVLFTFGIASIRKSDTAVRNLAWAIGLSIIPYLLLMPSQGHGWGYRFLHPLLANFALIAVHGWVCLRSRVSSEFRVQFAGGLCAATILFAAVSFPARMNQAYSINHPFATAAKYIRTLDTDIVLIDSKSIWFGNDFIRNDPLLRNRPKIMAADQLDDKSLAILCGNRDVILIGFHELATFGVDYIPALAEEEELRRRNLLNRLKTKDCNPISVSNQG